MFLNDQCEVCVDKAKYFRKTDGRCVDCPSFAKLVIPIGSIAAILVTIAMARNAAFRYPFFGHFLIQISLLWHSIGPQAKIKIFISFYQVVTTLQPVYGVQFDSRFERWFDFLEYFNFTSRLLLIPESCFGSMETRLVINAAWPFFVIFFGFLVISVFSILTHEKVDDGYGTNLKSVIRRRTLKFTIVFIYIVLPGVSRAIFDAWKCKSFVTNDGEGSTRSYLLSDLTMRCSETDSSEYVGVKRLFWVFFVLWPLVIPLLMLGLLWKVRTLVRTKRITPLAEACSFLWRDYNGSMMYWEIIDLYRKIFLTGFILFIDPEDGSNRILRLLMASVISFIYFGVLLRARPYKRSIDLDLAFISNILLLCCFTLGIILQFCQDDKLMD